MYDNFGNHHYCRLYGIPEISSNIEAIDVSGVIKHFAKYKIDLKKLQRPSGHIDVLLGMQSYKLHPRAIPGFDHGNLSVHGSVFSTGLVLAGHDDNLKCGTIQRSSVAHVLSMAKVTTVSFTDNETQKMLYDKAKLNHISHAPWKQLALNHNVSLINDRKVAYMLATHMNVYSNFSSGEIKDGFEGQSRKGEDDSDLDDLGADSRIQMDGIYTDAPDGGSS